MSRAHLFRSLRDSEGNLKPTSTVMLRKPGTEDPIDQPLYASPTGQGTLSNPFTATLGMVDVYLEEAETIDLFLDVEGEQQTLIRRLSVLPPAPEIVRSITPLTIINTPQAGQILLATGVETEAEWGEVPALTGEAVAHDHEGAGVGSVALGPGADADGTDAVALGPDSNAPGVGSLAIGRDAQATGLGAVAVGQQTQASEDAIAIGLRAGSNTGTSQWVSIGVDSDASGMRSIAVGAGAVASGDDSVALGAASSALGPRGVAIGLGSRANAADSLALGPDAWATHARSTAIGAGAQTTADDQVVLGAESHTVVVPGRLNATGGDVLIGAADIGRVGFFGTAPKARPVVTGSRGGNTALASLLSALVTLGLIEDGTSA